MPIKLMHQWLSGKQCMLISIACVVSTISLASPPWQSHGSILQTAQKFLNDYYDGQYETHIKFGYLDKRLKLSQCQQGLQAFLPLNRKPLGATSIGVRCALPAWKIHVPVVVKAYTEVMVTKHPIARHAQIQASDVIKQRREISRYYHGVYTETAQVIGMVAKRAIRQDRVLSANALKPKRLVSRGDMIVILAESNGLRIRTQGEALMDGHQGQIIRVENKRSGREVAGEVIAPSTVRVKM